MQRNRYFTDVSCYYYQIQRNGLKNLKFFLLLSTFCLDYCNALFSWHFLFLISFCQIHWHVLVFTHCDIETSRAVQVVLFQKFACKRTLISNKSESAYKYKHKMCTKRCICNVSQQSQGLTKKRHTEERTETVLKTVIQASFVSDKPCQNQFIFPTSFQACMNHKCPLWRFEQNDEHSLITINRGEWISKYAINWLFF